MSDLLANLREKHGAKLHLATTHRFTDELCAGKLSDERLFTYLVQDQKFFMTSLRMLARTISLCDDDSSLVVLGKQMGFLANSENTYFTSTLAELSSQLGREAELPTLPEVSEFLDLLSELAASNSYVKNIVAFYAFELVYLLWAEPHEHSVDHLAYKHKEWVYLHSGADFTKWVSFLESEVTRVLNDDNQDEADRIIARVLDLEWAFFEATYNYTYK